MSIKPEIAPRKKPKPLADLVDAKLPFDRQKARKTNRRAIQAADRLLREIDDFLKQTPRKP